MTHHRFELVGGDPSLDFLNTVDDWTASEPREYLSRLQDAIRFAGAARIVSGGEARHLARCPAGQELRRLRELRAGLERIFRASIGGRAVPRGDLERLARDASEAAHAAELREADGRLVRAIDVRAAGASVLRYRIAEAAVSLLTSPRLDRVKTCPGCGWFFLDATKNGSRRWCSMGACGSSAKARRYYWRSRRRRPTSR